MANPEKILMGILKASASKKPAAKKVGSAASKGRTGTNVNAKGKKVSEGKAKGPRPSVRPEDKLKPGMKAKTDELGFAVSKQRITKGVVPNLGATKTPFVRNNTEANKKLKEINNNLSTLRNSWKAAPPSKRSGIENSAKRLQSQKDALIKQLKKGK
jgi:hypothetical protein